MYNLQKNIFMKLNFSLIITIIPPFGLFLVNDMQTLTPLPPYQNWPCMHERCSMSWNEWNINFSSYGVQRKLGYKKNWGTKMTKNNHNSKNINRKNHKFDFSFDSVDYTSFMWISTLSKKKLEFLLFKYWNIFEKKIVKFFWWRVIFIFFNSASGPVIDNNLQTHHPFHV